MARVSRVESQARTRAQILETATAMFLTDGYVATSLEKVAEAAGYTRGAVYSNFRNKDELCMAVLDEYRAGKVAEIAAATEGPTLAARLAQFEDWAERVIGDPNWTRLELEFAAHASRDDELSQAMVRRLRGLLDLVSSVVQIGAAETEGGLPLPDRELAVALLSLAVGLGLFRAIDPDLPIGALTNTLRLLAGEASADRRD